VIETIERDDLLTHVKSVGEWWAAAFDVIDHPLFEGHRGTGLWRALQLAEPLSASFESAARNAGFLVNAVQPDAVRLAPPLILTQEEAESFAAALPALLGATAEAGAA